MMTRAFEEGVRCPLTSELQVVEGRVSFQRKEVQRAVQPGSNDPGGEMHACEQQPSQGQEHQDQTTPPPVRSHCCLQGDLDIASSSGHRNQPADGKTS